MLDLRQLTALVAVHHEGSVAAAAKALGWSQPTVAHHLSALGREIGAPVVVPRASGTVLTEAGHELLPHAAAIGERAARARREVREFVDVGRRRISIGVYPTIAPRVLPALVSSLEAAGFTLSVLEAEVDVLHRRLADMTLDAALVYTASTDPLPDPPAITRRRLLEERLMAVLPAGHPLASRAAIRLGDLRTEAWVLGAQPDEPLELMLLAAAARVGFEPRARVRSDDYRVVAAYIAAGHGVALIPAYECSNLGSDVVAVELADPPLARTIELRSAAAMEAAVSENIAAVVLRHGLDADAARRGGEPVRASTRG